MKKVKTESKKIVKDIGMYDGWKDRVCPSALEFEKNTFVLEQAKCTIYSIFNYPSEAGVKWLRPLITMPNTMISIYNEEADKTELLKSIDFTIREQQIKQAEKMEAELRLAQDAADKIDKAMNLSQRIMADNVSVDRITIYIMAFAEDEVELKKVCQDIEGKLSAYRFICRRFPYMQEAGFDSMNPICDNKYKPHTSIMMPSDVFWAGLGVVPSFGINDPTGLFLGWDETANPIFMDIWQKSHNKTNYNLAVMGKPGSGKSASCKNLIIHEIAMGTKLFILDPEEEYLYLADQFGGNIINASGGINSEGERSIINPLQLTDFPEEWDDLTPETIALLAKENNFQGSVSQKITQLKKWFKIYIPEFTMSHISLLETALYETYKRKGLNESTDPRKLSNLDNPIMTDLGNVLTEWESAEKDPQKKQLFSEILVYLESALHGTDRFLFNGYTNVDLSNHLNVFNVKALLTAPDNIKNAQFSNITSFVWLALTKDKSEKTVLDVDEAHLFINKNSTATFEFLGQLCKRARKYSAGLWITTQNVSDFLHEEVALYGEGILNNSGTLLLMKANGTDLQKLTNLFLLNEGEQERIKNAGIGQGLLMAGDMRVFANVRLNDTVLEICKQGGGR